MTASVIAVSRRISTAELESLTSLFLFSGVGLFASLLAMSCGLDLGSGF